jgi:hypothetical protein
LVVAIADCIHENPANPTFTYKIYIDNILCKLDDKLLLGFLQVLWFPPSIKLTAMI